MVALNQMVRDLLAVTCRRLKNPRHRVLIEVKDSGAGTDTVAFGQGCEHAVNRPLIRMKTGEDATVASTELTATFPTPVEWCTIRTIVANQLKVFLTGLASVGAAEKRYWFHGLVPIEKNTWREHRSFSNTRYLGNWPMNETHPLRDIPKSFLTSS